jgi:hypothetical protein
MNIFGHSSAPVLAVDDMTVHIETPANDPPEFKRVYTTKLVYAAADGASVDIRLKITCRTTMFGERNHSDGELMQDNGRWVMFDPRNPAEKIIDRALCPLVIAACKRILASDTVFIMGNPYEFEDRQGVKWQREK